MELSVAKIIILLALAAIIAALFSAGFFMLKRDSEPKAMVRALTVRISLSVVLLIGILIASASGLLA